MPKRHELTDDQWALISDIFPVQGRGGRWSDHRTAIDGMMWRLRTGAPLARPPRAVRALEDHLRSLQRLPQVRPDRPDPRTPPGPAQRRWPDRRRAVLHRRHRHPGQPGGRRGPQHRRKKVAGEPADHALGRSRGGFGTKVHLVCDGNGLPLAAVVTPGQRQECTQFEAAMGAVRLPGRRGRPRCRPVKLAGDKGYSYPRIRRWLARHGIVAVIPRRSDQRPDDKRAHFDADAYKRRSVVERCMGWLKECRAMATRFDKLAVNYLATVKLAMIQRYLRKLAPQNDPSDRT